MLELLTGLGLALPAGLNAYIPLLAVGLTARFTNLISLSPPFDFLASDIGLALVGILLVVEMVADKVPIVDHVNDLVQTLVRPGAGAVLMLASTGAVDYIDPGLAFALGLLAAGSVHAIKSSTRAAVTGVTGGLGNPAVSAAEDGVAVTASLIAILFPALVVGILIGLIVLAFWLFRRLRRRSEARAP